MASEMETENLLAPPESSASVVSDIGPTRGSVTDDVQLRRRLQLNGVDNYEEDRASTPHSLSTNDEITVELNENTTLLPATTLNNYSSTNSQYQQLWDKIGTIAVLWHRQWEYIRPCCIAAVGRAAQMILLLVGLIIISLLLKILADPSQYDYASLQFDWKTAPERDLLPIGVNESISADYNVRLDGHAHTTISDGKLTPVQLVDWAVGK
jgi:hypothetical protein